MIPLGFSSKGQSDGKFYGADGTTASGTKRTATDIRTNPSPEAQFKEFMQGMNRPVMPPTTAPIALCFRHLCRPRWIK